MRQDCEDVREIYGLLKDFTEAAAPGAYVTDIFPFLAKLPTFLQWWRRSALEAYDRQATIWLKYWNALQKLIDQKAAPECFVKQFAADIANGKHGIDEVSAAFVAGSTYSGHITACKWLTYAP